MLMLMLLVVLLKSFLRYVACYKHGEEQTGRKKLCLFSKYGTVIS